MLIDSSDAYNTEYYEEELDFLGEIQVWELNAIANLES